MASKNRTANPLLLAFIIPLTLACLWTLIPTYVKYSVNKDADAYAEKQLENIVAINQIDEAREAVLRDSFETIFSQDIIRVNYVALQQGAERQAQAAFRLANNVPDEFAWDAIELNDSASKAYESQKAEILQTLQSELLADSANQAKVQNATEKALAQATAYNSLNVEQANTIREGYARSYKDSVRDIEDNLFLIWNYKKVEAQSISLGLDLQGGLAVTLVIDQADALAKLATPTKQTEIREIIKKADAEFKAGNEVDYLTVFQKVFEESTDEPMGSFFNTERLSTISNSSTTASVISTLRNEMADMLDGAETILKTRIDQFGVASPEISKDKTQGHIYMELAGVDNPDRIQKLIEQSAELGFYNVIQPRERFGDQWTFERFLEPVDEAIKAQFTQELNTTSNDSLILVPLIDGNTMEPSTGYPSAAYIAEEHIAYFDEVIADKAIMKGITQDNYRIFRDKKPIDNNQDDAFEQGPKYYGVYVVEGSTSRITGDELTDAYQFLDPMNNEPAVNLSMNRKGAEIWADMTRKASLEVNEAEGRTAGFIAIVLDEKVISAPRSANEITGGGTQISGSMDVQEARDLSNILTAGKLDAQVQVTSSDFVGPTLGKRSMRSGLMSLAIGMGAIVVFMLLYYGGSGVIALAALILNLFYIISCLAGFGATLTLPGMAGIVLTVGMAVDANVIIFERIKEEVRKGKGYKLAIQDGFNRSYSAIIDANVTTFIVAFLLYKGGFGPVKGFAIVLMIGILTTLLAAVVIARIGFNYLSQQDRKVTFDTSLSKVFSAQKVYKFLSMRKISYAISGVLVAASIAAIVTQSFDLGVDFKGGRSYTVEFDQNIDATDVADKLEAKLGKRPTVKTYGSEATLQITTSVENLDGVALNDDAMAALLYGELETFYASPSASLDDFRQDYIKGTSMIETSVADDIRKSAVFGGSIGVLLIFVYIFIRFRKWQFGFGAIAAILHDALIILGLFAILKTVMPFSMEMNRNIIAALLTIIGYSINDTVVVFDRIREYITERPKTALEENVNEAVSSTLSRTLMTSVTTLLVVLILFFFGGPDLKSLSFALIVGIIIGTYSSIFVATPLAVDFLKRQEGNK